LQNKQNRHNAYIEKKNMVNIIHRIGIKATANKVYNALATVEGLSAWWTEEVEGSAEAGGNLQFTFRAEGGDIKGQMRMEVKELHPQQSVRWQCVEGPAEWIGTSITFDLSVQDGQTIVLFGHRDWREEVEFMAHCSTKWAVFLLSLRDYVETGKGKPSPCDLKIDNWN
jgi:uncharacterized protein YndB with AHSA1/START domain